MRSGLREQIDGVTDLILFTQVLQRFFFPIPPLASRPCPLEASFILLPSRSLPLEAVPVSLVAFLLASDPRLSDATAFCDDEDLAPPLPPCPQIFWSNSSGNLS